MSILAPLWIAGCTYTVEIDTPLDRSPLIDPMPVTVGVYFAPEFRGYEHRQVIRGELWDNTWTFSLGAASVALLDQAFASMFEKVVPMHTAMAAPAEQSDIRGIIEPKIERFYMESPSPSDIHTFPVPLSRYVAAIDYRITLYSPTERKVVASWVVSGSGALQHTFVSEGFPLTFWVKALYREITMKAIREAAAELIVGFRDRPEVRSWLDQIARERPSSAQ